jgi:hypothetical protein
MVAAGIALYWALEKAQSEENSWSYRINYISLG